MTGGRRRLANSIVVGSGPGGAFYWDWRCHAAPTYIGGLFATAVSGDGTWIVGSITDPIENDTVAARWSVATGWESLGWLPDVLELHLNVLEGLLTQEEAIARLEALEAAGDLK